MCCELMCVGRISDWLLISNGPDRMEPFSASRCGSRRYSRKTASSNQRSFEIHQTWCFSSHDGV